MTRLGVVKGRLEVLERRKPVATPTNDLYILDAGPVLQVSREHFQIEQISEGRYELIDRGSACGTIVGNHLVGGHDQGGRCPLEDGNVIVIGTSKSPYAFKFLCTRPHD